MADIRVRKFDEVYVIVECNNRAITMEVSDLFEFEIPGAAFHPKVKNGWWDGKIRLYNTGTRKLYYGLYFMLIPFCEEMGYELELDSNLKATKLEVPTDVGYQIAAEHGLLYTPYDFQAKSVYTALKDKRGIFKSPTSSGKSYIIYLIAKFLGDLGHRSLVIVPTTALVAQMRDDFAEYNTKETLSVHCVKDAKTKWSKADIVISTWQSIYKMDQEYFSQYDVVFADEAHHFQANSVSKILEKMSSCEYRFGFTGTLNDIKTHKLVLQGLIGPIHDVITTKELMDRGIVAKLKIKCVVLEHDKSTIPSSYKVNEKTGKKRKVPIVYKDEIEHLASYDKRNAFITKLALNLKGNTLILFTRKTQGAEIARKLTAKGKKFFYIDGDIKGEKRNDIRKLIEKEENIILLASYGTTSTGINIVKLHNVIFASPYKSKIKVLQSIGRGLRRGGEKVEATLYDIVDDMRRTKAVNTTLKHFKERIQIYNQEQFDYTIHNIKLGI